MNDIKNRVQQHEIDRVRSMTDDQLHVRYKKMKKIKKIMAFQKALSKENRCPILQKDIEIDWNVCCYVPPVKAVHRLYSNQTGNVYVFHQEENAVNNINILVTLNGSPVESQWGCGEGLYSNEQARLLWNHLVGESYTKMEE